MSEINSGKNVNGDTWRKRELKMTDAHGIITVKLWNMADIDCAVGQKCIMKNL